jgi:hypothetical protein
MQEAFRSERAAALKRTSGGYHPQFGPPLVTARGPLPGAAAAAVPSAAASLYSPHVPSRASAPGGALRGSPGSGGGSGDGSGDEDDGSEDEEGDDDDDNSSPLGTPGGIVGSGYYGNVRDHGDDDDDDSEMARFARASSRAGGPPRKRGATASMGVDDEGRPVVVDRGHTWHVGSVALGVDDDKYWLSELQVYLRANFAEAFAATEEDIAAPMHGRNKPIALGQVGIRCTHCKCTLSCFFSSF